MTNTIIERGKDRKVHYKIQARPGTVRLVADFNEFESDVLRRFIDILINTEKQWDDKTPKIEATTSNCNLAPLVPDT